MLTRVYGPDIFQSVQLVMSIPSRILKTNSTTDDIYRNKRIVRARGLILHHCQLVIPH